MERHCDEVIDLLSPYLDHALSAEEEHTVEVHLSHCETCRDELHKLMKLSDALRGQEQIAAPADFLPRLKQRMNSGSQVDAFLKNFLSNPSMYIPAGVLTVAVLVYGVVSSGRSDTTAPVQVSADVSEEVSSEYDYEREEMPEPELYYEPVTPLSVQALPDPVPEPSVVAPLPAVEPKEVLPVPVPVFKSVESPLPAEKTQEMPSLSTVVSRERPGELSLPASIPVTPVEPGTVRRVSEALNSFSADVEKKPVPADQKSIVIWDEEEKIAEAYSLDDLVGTSKYTAAELEHLSAEEQRVLDEALARASEETGVPVPVEPGSGYSMKVEVEDDAAADRLEPVSKNVIDVATSDPDMALARFRDAMTAQGLSAMTMNVDEAPYLISLYATQTQIRSLINTCRSSGIDGLEEPADMPLPGESAIFYVTIDKK